MSFVIFLLRANMNENSETSFLTIKQRAMKSVTQQLKRAKKRAAERLQILQNCLEWEKIAHTGELLQANLFRIRKGMSIVIVEDWRNQDLVGTVTLTLDPLVAPHLQVAACFKRSRKLRTGEVHARRMLKQTEDEVELREQQLKALEEILTPTGLEAYCRLHHIQSEQIKSPLERNKIVVSPKPYKSYLTQSGMEVWVGKDARCNDLLTFQYAKGADWWFHAHGYAGSHVVLRCNKDNNPDAASLKEAAELALRFSKASVNKQGEVCVTQVKWVKRVKSIPGRVTLSQYKLIYVTL